MTEREPAHGEYSEDLNAVWDADSVSWTCCTCLGVVGSIGCCRYRPPTLTQDTPAPAAAPTPPPGPPKLRERQRRAKPRRPLRAWDPSLLGGPFEVRGVDEARRRYFLLDGPIDRYADACLVADIARVLFLHHVVVWDRHAQRVLYDSRQMPSKWPDLPVSGVAPEESDDDPLTNTA